MIVDGNNVLGSRPDGWWRDRAGATRRLVERLGAWAAASGEDLVVVFDGRPLPDLAAPARVEVRFAPSADDAIAALVEADPAPERLRVVTSDAELGRRVSAHGAAVTGAGGFRDRIDAVRTPAAG